jgi:hypothetical protein
LPQAASRKRGRAMSRAVIGERVEAIGCLLEEGKAPEYTNARRLALLGRT